MGPRPASLNSASLIPLDAPNTIRGGSEGGSWRSCNAGSRSVSASSCPRRRRRSNSRAGWCPSQPLPVRRSRPRPSNSGPLGSTWSQPRPLAGAVSAGQRRAQQRKGEPAHASQRSLALFARPGGTGRGPVSPRSARSPDAGNDLLRHAWNRTVMHEPREVGVRCSLPRHLSNRSHRRGSRALLAAERGGGTPPGLSRGRGRGPSPPTAPACRLPAHPPPERRRPWPGASPSCRR